MTRVKICGIRTFEAAEAATDAGAEYLGFNFVPESKRYIRTEDAGVIIEILRRKKAPLMVGVFQNAPISRVNEYAEDLGLDFVQLHGAEDAAYIQKIHVPVIKSFTLSDNPEKIEVAYLLLDRPEQGKGTMVNMDTARELAALYPLFLAGGLTPENVGEAVSFVRPFAVDVAQGIETDGRQDVLKIRMFIENAKQKNI